MKIQGQSDKQLKHYHWQSGLKLHFNDLFTTFIKWWWQADTFALLQSKDDALVPSAHSPKLIYSGADQASGESDSTDVQVQKKRHYPFFNRWVVN